MRLRGTRVAAVALAAAAFTRSSAADGARSIEDGVAAAERALADVERVAQRPDDAPAARAARTLEAGEARYALQDWASAAVLLSGALDDPGFRGAPERPEALFLLADALRRQGACGAARPRYAELLSAGGGARRAEAIIGAIDCAVRERRARDVEALLEKARSEFGGDLPAEVRYAAAKSLFQRDDLAPRERVQRAAAAFDRVGKPFQLQAWYFQGVLAIQQGNLHRSLQWFEACARADAAVETAPRPAPAPDREGRVTGRDAEVRDLCMLALGRVHAEMGNASAAVQWYSAVPPESARYPEALYELAWAQVKDQRHAEALRTASFVVDLAPESPLAPDATVLQGHLLLRLGRYAEAIDAYNRVINAYAPVRDELDAILAMREDPVRSLDALAARQGGTPDAAAVLPSAAARWAASHPDAELAVGLVRSLGEARRELRESREIAARLEALLARSGGLDAFPALRRASAGAEALENDLALLEGGAAGLQSAAAERALSPEGRQELSRARGARQGLEERLRRLPRTQAAADERALRTRARLVEVDRAAYQAGYLVDALAAGVAATTRWIEERGAELEKDPEGRRQLAEELRRHREVVAGYEEELRGIRRDAAIAREAAGGAAAAEDGERLREAYLAAVAGERDLAEAARGALPAPDRDAFARAGALRERIAAARARVREIRPLLAASAARRAAGLRERVTAEQAALAAQAAALDAVQGAANDLVGRVARRSFAEVREQLHRLVLKADVGIVDAAWSRKRRRLERVQELSQEKAAELEQLDREYRAIAPEVD